MRKGALVVTLATLATGVIAGCGGAVQNGDEPLSPMGTPVPLGTFKPEHDIEMVQQKQLGIPGSLNDLPQMGGSGGFDFGTWDQGIVYAFRVRYGTRVDQIELAYYVPTNPNDSYTPGDTVGSIGAFGGSGGSDSGWIYCINNYVAVGIHGRHGTRIDKFGLICGQLGNLSVHNSTAAKGGNGGSEYGSGGYVCDFNGYLSGIAGRSNVEVDRIVGQCRTSS
jgi:hypothetical protein